MLMLLYDSPTRNGQTSSFAIIRRECNPSKGGGEGGLKLKAKKKKKEGEERKKRNERWLIPWATACWWWCTSLCLPQARETKREGGEILDGILTFSPLLCGGGGRAKEGDVDEGLKNSKVRGIKKRNLITSWNGISSYRLTDIWYFMRNARPNFPRMEFYDSRGNKFSSFPSPPSLSPPPLPVCVRACTCAFFEKNLAGKKLEGEIIIRLLWFLFLEGRRGGEGRETWRKEDEAIIRWFLPRWYFYRDIYNHLKLSNFERILDDWIEEKLV